MINNNILKIISVIIAVIVWFIVATSEQQEVSFYVPVKFKNEGEGLKAFTDTSLISVLVKGPKISMKNFTFNDIKIEIDLSNFQSGEYLYRIKPTDVMLPSGIHLIRLEPQDIRIMIDKLGKKTVKVIPSFIGDLKDGYKISSVVITPSYVTIYGTSKKIKALESVETLPINISGVDANLKQKVGIKVGEIISDAKPGEVQVELKIVENIIVKNLNNLSFILENLNPHFKVVRINPDRVDLSVKGRSDKLNSLDNLKLFVDLSKINKDGIYELPIKVTGTEGVEVVDIIPSKIKIEVRR
ncbi:CdaR family protein [Calditerrivibrio nitroreducens]|uniref:YbbR family protein n=1 Tax=Calditerrivibrio nitroreducens (strain DSM 19672 / NBRC 101217 / Yu37-1) TaxID=768670 RepID=E4TK74_CALNY|nr:CdaR family protein [Calditerrivibrio nitroreducens]ADR19350.1 YbbR family protein [Calditerrivibrio nitroreducens DSM 19672]